ncbi:MAG: MFS transporter [Planctomycetes bacterium]|nr:MFS transporter [Planctomycetota bacterium]
MSDGAATGIRQIDCGSRPTRVRFQVMAWLAAAAAIAYVCRNSLAVAEKTIRRDLDISETQMGWILGPAFFWSYALAQIPTAWCGQKWGSRRCLPWIAALWSFAIVASATARGWTMLLATRVAAGIAQAGIFPCATRTMADWHPRTERALASGLLTAAMSTGGALGALATGALLAPRAEWTWLPPVSWRCVFALYALPGLIWAAGFWRWFRDIPAEHPGTNEAERRLAERSSGQDAQELGIPWARLAASPAMWLIAGQQFFRAAGYAFFSSWFPTYLQEAKGVSTAGSGVLTALPLLAIVVSAIAGGGLSDLVLRSTGSLNTARKGVASTMLIVATALVGGAYFVEGNTEAVLLISLGVFFSGFASPCAYAVSMDMGGAHVAAVFSTMNMFGNFGAGLLPWLVPHFKRAWESHPMLMRFSGGNAWAAVLFLFAAMYLAAAICWLMLRANGTVVAERDQATH